MAELETDQPSSSIRRIVVAALEFDRRRSLRATARPVALVGIAAALYVVIYVFAFPTSKSYYELGSHVLARIPQQLAAFLYLGESRPYVLAVTSAGLFSLVVIVRGERAQPLVEILREAQGMPKLPYTRHEDPYGLIDTAALFEWVLSREGTREERIDDWASVFDGAVGSVVVHREGGFTDLGVTSDVAAEAARWRAEQRHLRVVRAVPLD